MNNGNHKWLDDVGWFLLELGTNLIQFLVELLGIL